MAGCISIKVLTTLSQLDLVLSFILFLVENLVPFPNPLVHSLVLASASCSVLLSLLEMIFISKGKFGHLLAVAAFRLGPLVAISIVWIIYTYRTPYLSVGGISLSFHVAKGLVIMVACAQALNRLKQERIEKYQCNNPVLAVEVTPAIPSITIQISPPSNASNAWDPLEPAYDALGQLRRPVG